MNTSTAQAGELPEDCNDPVVGIRERFPDLIHDFRVIAGTLLDKFPAPSLASGDLLNEGFLRLLGEEANRRMRTRSELGSKSDRELKACFGAACKDVIFKRYGKRRRRRETVLEVEPERKGVTEFDIIEASELLLVLEACEPLQAHVVEARVFGGLTLEECAEVFGVSLRTVNRRYQEGLDWIARQLSRPRS